MGLSALPVIRVIRQADDQTPREFSVETLSERVAIVVTALIVLVSVFALAGTEISRRAILGHRPEQSMLRARSDEARTSHQPPFTAGKRCNPGLSSHASPPPEGAPHPGWHPLRFQCTPADL
jgi:hypothetical protein